MIWLSWPRTLAKDIDLSLASSNSPKSAVRAHKLLFLFLALENIRLESTPPLNKHATSILASIPSIMDCSRASEINSIAVSEFSISFFITGCQ